MWLLPKPPSPSSSPSSSAAMPGEIAGNQVDACLCVRTQSYLRMYVCSYIWVFTCILKYNCIWKGTFVARVAYTATYIWMPSETYVYLMYLHTHVLHSKLERSVSLNVFDGGGSCRLTICSSHNFLCGFSFLVTKNLWKCYIANSVGSFRTFQFNGNVVQCVIYFGIFWLCAFKHSRNIH